MSRDHHKKSSFCFHSRSLQEDRKSATADARCRENKRISFFVVERFAEWIEREGGRGNGSFTVAEGRNNFLSSFIVFVPSREPWVH